MEGFTLQEYGSWTSKSRPIGRLGMMKEWEAVVGCLQSDLFSSKVYAALGWDDWPDLAC